MLKLFSITSTGDQSSIVSAETASTVPVLELHLGTLNSPDDQKTAHANLKKAIETYLPLLNDRIDKVAKKLGAIGDIYTNILYRQQQIQIMVNTTASQVVSNDVFQQAGDFTISPPEQKQLWADALTGGNVQLLSESMARSGALFYSVLQDASRNSWDSANLSDFYSKYGAHLLAVQNTLSAERQSLMSCHSTLTTVLGILSYL